LLQAQGFFDENTRVNISHNVTTYTNTSGIAVPKEINFSWIEVRNAIFYELEWTWVDNYSKENLTTPLSASVIKFNVKDFEKNSTRVTLSQPKNSYQIPALYGNGYILYRIRAVGGFQTVSDSYKFGIWTTSGTTAENDNASINDWPNKQLISHHDATKNWQFQASYAEEGKKKEVVSYFDGTLRNRQTVTKINSEENENIIVGEVIYDAQGRPAVEVLPTPIYEDKGIKFYDNITKVDVNTPYSYRNFDFDEASNSADACETTPAYPTHNSAGASKYYSINNPSITDVSKPWQAFVPKANNFPFSQIEYTPDNTGRIQRKSGVGSNHQLDTKHEMKYFYETAKQFELDRLFGNGKFNVGNALHYKKNTVIDPNGQISVSYIDPQGRTIATALAGGAPRLSADSFILNPITDESKAKDSFDPLNKVNANDTDTLLDKNILENTGNFGANYDKLYHQSIFTVVSEDEQYDVNYKLKNNVGVVKAGSFNSPECYEGSFVYDVKLSLIDECGQDVLLSNNIDGTSLTVNSLEQSFPLTSKRLKIGKYILTKEIQVNKEVLDGYILEYEDNLLNNESSDCFVSVDDFIQEGADTFQDECIVDCESCRATLGISTTTNVEQAKTNYISERLIESEQTSNPFLNTLYSNEFDALLDECNKSFCNEVSIGEVGLEEVYTSQMLSEVSLLGQYALGDELSVFNENNLLPFTDYNGNINTNVSRGKFTGNNWRNPRISNSSGTINTYLDDQGKESFVRVRVVDLNKQNRTIVTDPPMLSDQNIQVLYYDENIVLSSSIQVKPQHLAFVKDFKLLWRDSWAQSLVHYHPEYSYLDFARALDAHKVQLINTGLNGIGKVINVSEPSGVELSVNGYDEILRNVKSDITQEGENIPGVVGEPKNKLQKAIASGLLDAHSSIAEKDPLYSIPGAVPLLSYAVRNYKEQGQSLTLAAYRAVFCANPDVFQCDDTALNTTTSILNKIVADYDGVNSLQNRFWDTYASLYISLKQSVIEYLIHKNAFDKEIVGAGGYNGGIGPQSLQITAALSGISTISEPNYSNQFTYNSSVRNLYRNKTQVVKGSASIEEETSNSNTEADIARLAQEADFVRFKETGRCPLSYDMEIFVSGFFEEQILQLPSAPINRNLSYLGFDLYKALFPNLGVENPSLEVVIINNHELSINLTAAGVTSTILLKISGIDSRFTWSNYGSLNRGGWYFTKISDLIFNEDARPVNGRYEFNINAVGTNISGANPLTKQLLIEGSSTVSLGNCRDELEVIGETLQNSRSNSIVGGTCRKRENFAESVSLLMTEYLKSETIRGILDLRRTNGTLATDIVLPVTHATDILGYDTSYVKNFLGDTKSEMLIESSFQSNNSIWSFALVMPGNPHKFLNIEVVGSSEIAYISDITKIEIGEGVNRDKATISWLVAEDGNFVERQNVKFVQGMGAPIDFSCASCTDKVLVPKNEFIANQLEKAINRLLYDYHNDSTFDTSFYFSQERWELTQFLNVDQGNREFNGFFGMNFTPVNSSVSRLNLFIEHDNGTPIKPFELFFEKDNSSSKEILTTRIFNLRVNSNLSGNSITYEYKDKDGYIVDQTITFPYLILCSEDGQPITPNTNLSGLHIAFVLDTSGSISRGANSEASQIITGLVGDGQQQEGFFNTQLNNGILYSVTSMSSSTANDFSPHVLNGSNISNIENSVRGIYSSSLGGDSWTTGFSHINSYSIQPNLVILITDGSSEKRGNSIPNNLISLYQSFSTFNLVPNNFDNQSRHTFVFSIEGSPASADFPNSGDLLNFLNQLNGIRGELSRGDDILMNDYQTFNSFGNLCLGLKGLTGQVNDILTPSEYCAPIASCSTCIPQPATPVDCELAYENFRGYMDTSVDGYSFPWRYTKPVSQVDPNEIEDAAYFEKYKGQLNFFCHMRLELLVDDYIEYLRAFNIYNVEDPLYIDIEEFGNTDLNYGYKRTRQAIQAYARYYDSASELGVAEEDRYTWNQFINNQYMLENNVCPAAPIFIEFPEILDINPKEEIERNCTSFLLQLQQAYAQQLKKTYVAQQVQNFKEEYLSSATNNLVEKLDLSYVDQEYQYTLYYYDQAGNLVQTVPPEGVKRNGSGVHNLETKYRYNSLNQLVWQSTPDGGITTFAYDNLGRIIASQNSKQAKLINNKKRISYTRYDGLGRIIEAGQVPIPLSYIIENGRFKNATGVQINAIEDSMEGYEERTQVTETVYSEPLIASNFKNSYNWFNSRNRVSWINYYESTSILSHSLLYSYDIHGNVKELVSRNKFSTQSNIDITQEKKSVCYEYDLISGNVNKVIYQKGELDQFIHKYSYDDDNRITMVETSNDDEIWEKDAEYHYYDHGPLARVLIGEREVQAMDYAYTIQGWLKGVNSEDLNPNSDLGKDGIANSSVAKDAFGYSLNYFSNDYEPIGDQNPFARGQESTKNLYNGNIKSMVTSLLSTNQQPLSTQRNDYEYDQLNRITSFKGYDITNGNNNPKYQSTYTYDKNGNIATLTRKVDNNLFDNLSYTYGENAQGKINNQLQTVADASGRQSTEGIGDLPDQEILLSEMGININDNPTHNYIYDEIGQLVEDRTEGLTIEWRVDGKVSKVSKNDGTEISFGYDGLGNRISKTINAPGDDSLPGNIRETFYNRDAQGNVLAVYRTGESVTIPPASTLELTGVINGNKQAVNSITISNAQIANQNSTTIVISDQGSAIVQPNTTIKPGGIIKVCPVNEINTGEIVQGLSLTEQHIYGSSRLGLKEQNIALNQTTPTSEIYINNVSEFTWQQASIISNRASFNSANTIAFKEFTQGKYVLEFAYENNTQDVKNTFLLSTDSDPNNTEAIIYSDSNLVSDGDEYIEEVNFRVVEPSQTIYLIFYSPQNIPYQGTVSELNVYKSLLPFFEIGDKRYELSNHLGNVMSVITDEKLAGNNPDVIAYNDYYPFGMLLPGRHDDTQKYRYGFQGQEKDDEIKGEGNSYDFGDRMLDPRIGRWFSTDMKSKEFQSNYNFAMNNPTIFVDPDGKDDYYFDTATKAVYIIKNGEPNRYFSIDYVFEPITKSGTVYTGKQVITPRSINSSFIKSKVIDGTSVYRYALKHATNKAQYKSIYNSLDTVDENAVIYGTLAVPLSVIAIAEIGIATILEETAEYVFEEVTGIPVVIDPIDLVEQAAKKSSKELVEVSIEQTVKQADNSVVENSAKEVSKKVSRGKQPSNSGKLEDIPGIGDSHGGKLDGLIPSRDQWMKYPKEDLTILQGDLRKSIKQRTVDLKTKGADYIHGLRLTDERRLLRDITKYLDGK